MSFASLLKKNFFEGGPMFMTLHYIMWILVIYFTIRFLLNYYSSNKDLKKLSRFNLTIVFLGSFGFLLSLFYQTLGFYGALTAIEMAGDVSPAILLGGLRISLIAPMYSLFLFLISSIIWFVFRNMINK